MDKIIKQYKESFAVHGNSPKAVFWPKGRQKERFVALVKNFNTTKEFSILDYGCGLSHFRLFLKEVFTQKVNYTGVDIVDDFIHENKVNLPNDNFILLTSHIDVTNEYDFIVSSGAFNILYTSSVDSHQKIIYDILSHLFSKTKVALSVNFMTDAVEFIQEGAFHQNVKELYDFASENLTKRLVIDQSYMPYEFTITLYKDQTIIRPENIYPNE
jgi:trans-aconitate methyltransferase